MMSFLVFETWNLVYAWLLLLRHIMATRLGGVMVRASAISVGSQWFKRWLSRTKGEHRARNIQRRAHTILKYWG